MDETIVSQACLQSDLSIIAMVKGNVGALTENILKSPYKLLFNGSTSSFTLYNAVMAERAVENYVKDNEKQSEGRKKLALVHGNRLLLHLVLKSIKNIDGFNTQYLDQEVINTYTDSLLPGLWNKVYDSMESHFPDGYPANIFKNMARLKEIVNGIEDC